MEFGISLLNARLRLLTRASQLTVIPDLVRWLDSCRLDTHSFVSVAAPMDQGVTSTPERTGSPIERGRESAEPADASVPAVPAAVEPTEAEVGQAAPPPSPPAASTPPAAAVRVGVDQVVFKTPIVAATPGSRARG